MLDKHREFIEVCISKELSATRVFQDLQRKYSFEGKYTTVRDYIRKLRNNHQKAFMQIEKNNKVKHEIVLLAGTDNKG